MGSVDATAGQSLPNDDQYDPRSLPDFETDFITAEELQAFSDALTAPTTTPVTALNDWKPIHQRIKKSKRRREPRRSKDETREGFVYSLLYYPLLFAVLGWIVVLVSDANLCI
jgi:hypothetical protein